MPLRYIAFCSHGRALVHPTPRPRPAGAWQHQHHAPLLLDVEARGRTFSTTRARRDNEIDRARNHYETLKVSTDATPAEIKKSFYALSKTHHPDHNGGDPAASRRFVNISEAYGTLSSPERRSRYDRDVLDLAAAEHHHPARRRGSYHGSANRAGGRPASGLSRRRGTFQGPPPSFFRSGGWGGHEAKRKAAHDSSTGGGGAGASTASNGNDGGTWATGGAAGAWDRTATDGGAGGMGPGSSPFRTRDGDVPHFDSQRHERTGRFTDARRAERAPPSMGSDEHDESSLGKFFAIGGVLLFSFLGPYTLGLLASSGTGRREDRIGPTL